MMSRTFVRTGSSSRAQSKRGGTLHNPTSEQASPLKMHREGAAHDPFARSSDGYGVGEGNGEGRNQYGGREERHLQPQGGYYVQRPRPSHNHKLKTMAQEEAAAYDQHKTAKRTQLAEQTRQLQPQALGGAKASPDELQESRDRQDREQKLNAKYASIHKKQKREEYIAAKRRREDEEQEERKKRQREKALKLERKRGATDQQRREEMRRARLARFDPSK